MRPAQRPSVQDLQQARERAQEWRQFRKDFLFSQGNLAHALKLCQRTVNAIENQETLWPTAATLRRFQALKRRHEDAEAERKHLAALRDAELHNAYQQQQRRA